MCLKLKQQIEMSTRQLDPPGTLLSRFKYEGKYSLALSK